MLLLAVKGDFFLAYRAEDAQKRVVDKLQIKDCTVVILSKSNRTKPREYDRHSYQARHLVENFFAKLNQYRGIATRYYKKEINFLGSIYLASFVVLLTKLDRYWR